MQDNASTGRDFPHTYREFVERFPSDEACAAYLALPCCREEQAAAERGSFAMQPRSAHAPRGAHVQEACRGQVAFGWVQPVATDNS